MSQDIEVKTEGDLITAKVGNIKTFELCAYVSGFMEGEISGWPNEIQDGLYAALERLKDKVKLPLAIVYSGCEVEYGGAVDKSDDKFFVRVVASEILVADDRYSGPDFDFMNAGLVQ